MKPLTKEEAEQLCRGLDYALEKVRIGAGLGLCNGLMLANLVYLITEEQSSYLRLWIRKCFAGVDTLKALILRQQPPSGTPFASRGSNG